MTDQTSSEVSERLVQPATTRLFLLVMGPCLIYAGIRYHIVLDVPLLAETGWEKRCDKLIFIACNRQKRVERAENPENFEKILLKRENFQISLDKKAKTADYIMYNNSDLSALAEQVARIFSIISVM